VSSSNILIIGMFCAMQVVAQLFFKWGSTSDARWLRGFLGGNVLGFSSIWLLMLVYKSINPNIALGICGGGSFLLAQLALALVFKSEVSFVQWGGVLAIVAGIILLAAGSPGSS
jgi:small multidrug resistance pump